MYSLVKKKKKFKSFKNNFPKVCSLIRTEYRVQKCYWRVWPFSATKINISLSQTFIAFVTASLSTLILVWLNWGLYWYWALSLLLDCELLEWKTWLGPSQFFYLSITWAQDKCSFDLQYKTKKSIGNIQGTQKSSAKTPNWPPNKLKYPINIYFSLSGVPCSPPGAIPGPGIKPASLTSGALAGKFSINSANWDRKSVV